MADEQFDRSALDSVLEQADAAGVYAAASGDWQPDADKVVAVLMDAGLSIRTDKDTKIKFGVCKPVLQVVTGVSDNGKDLAGKDFPLDRFGFKSHAIRDLDEIGMRQAMKSASVLVGEPINTAQGTFQAFEKGATTKTVVEVTRAKGVSKNTGKEWVNYSITAVIDTQAPVATEAPVA